MKSILLVISSLAVILLTTAAGWSHGVDGHVVQAQGYCVTASYDDGEPMGYAAVEIRAPDSEIVFQTGRIDRNGRFMFRPDGQGRWEVVVTDGMGHRVALPLEVGGEAPVPEALESSSPTASNGMTRPVKVVAGLSIIFGLSGFLYGWKARRMT